MSEIHALSGAYAVDALDDHERELFERHLTTCADCRDEVDSLREAAATLPAATETAPPESVRAAVLAGIGSVRPLPPQLKHREPEPPRSRRLLVAAAALIAFSGTALAVTQPWQDDRPDTVITAAERVIAASDATRSTVPMRGGEATLYHSESLGQAALVTSGVQDAPKERVYELWLMVDGAVVPAGTFHDGGSREILVEGEASEATWAGITIEPEGGSRAPTRDPIAQFDLTRT